MSVTKNVQGLNGKMDWQTVEFDRSNVDEDGKEHFFIFDDHPEHIRQCDIEPSPKKWTIKSIKKQNET